MIIDEWVPGTPEVPGVPTRYVELNTANWSSGSVSIPTTTGDGGYKFHVPASVVGVFVGIASNYPGTGYFGIQHALYFTRGTVAVYERGQQVGALGSYLSSDEFTIVQQAGKVWFLRNGVKEFDRPSRLSGTFRLASTQYIPGDSVVDAAVVGAASIESSADGRATMASFRAYGFDTAPGTWGVAELAPFGATATVQGHASGTATLGAILAIGSDRPIAIGWGTLPGFEAHGESGLLAPDFATGFAYAGPARASGRMISGGIGLGMARLKAPMAMGSDRPIAQGWAELPPIFAWGGEGEEYRGALLTTKGRYTLRSTISQGALSGFKATGPSPSLTATFGARVSLKGPRPSMSATVTSPNITRASLAGPGGFGLESSVTMQEVVNADLQGPGEYALVSAMGAHAEIQGPGGYSLSSKATETGRIDGHLTGPGFFGLQATVAAQGVIRANLVGPALQPAPRMYAWIVGPSFSLRSAISSPVTVAHESYVINLATGAVSRYTDFPFDRIHRFGGRHFGIRPDGVYELTGSTDDGVPIESTVKTFQTDFGTTNLKRVPYVYLFGRFGDDMTVGVQANEGIEYSFPAPAAVGGVQAVRAKAAQGIKGNAWAFSVANVGGGDFEIERVEVIVTSTEKAY